MLFKIILPFFLLAVVYFMGRVHANRKRQSNLPPPEAPFFLTMRHGPVGRIALILVASTVVAAGWMMFAHWQERAQWVEVHVVDVKTGQKTYYEALKGEIHGRVFTTRDGRRITLADVERMEILQK
ncbi:MAG: hypothetical protein HQL84_06280 [Magnetococcales bacterium]|nr:hypothetical protein [Magnetococcales bacterium]MBF0149639.1 hypothetical protein [Magnetococcales bacterium]MBF0172485.1 hypothetical protein [Magnetococcales bacterium]MBF0347571.1 hypothetical protein [Magnetococcales bacterium]MBF0632089.1 hypothetical protein [Magnetococcales bacterium]